MGALRGILFSGSVVTLAACDPCSGVQACDTPYATYIGEVIEFPSGEPIRGMTVTFERTGGVETLRPTVSVATDERGFYVLSVPTRARGTLTGHMRLHRSDGVEIITGPIDLETLRHRGDARRLPHLSPVAYVDLIWAVHRRGTREPVGEALVEFVRTEGVPLVSDTIRDITTSWGGWRLHSVAAERGRVVGVLTIEAPSGETFVRRIEEAADFWHPDAKFQGTLWVGPWLGYSARVVDLDGAPVAGASVTLRRTGGVPTRTPERTVWTDEDGSFNLDSFVVLEAGLLDLDLVVTPSGRPSVVIPGIQLEATEDDRFESLEDFVVDG